MNKLVGGVSKEALEGEGSVGNNTDGIPWTCTTYIPSQVGEKSAGLAVHVAVNKFEGRVGVKM